MADDQDEDGREGHDVRAPDEGDELSAAQRELLQRWQPPAPPPGFADRVMAARQAAGDEEASGASRASGGRVALRPTARRAAAVAAGPPRRRALAWGGGALAALAVAAVALSWSSRPARAPGVSDASSGAPDSGDARASAAPLRRMAGREALGLGGRGVAVAEAGAALGWRRDGAALRVEQEAGEVFYRVDPIAGGRPGEPKGSFTVATAAGEVRVTGTCFRVEVITMQPLKQGLIGAVAGAALATAVVVTVYEGKVVVASPSGSAQVRAGERVTLTPDRPPVLGSGAPAQAVAIAELPAAAPNASREELLARDETLRQQVAQLSKRVHQLQAVAMPGPGPGGGPGGGKQDSWLDKTPEQLLEFARECRVQLDLPPVMRGAAPKLDPETATALELSTAQVSDVNQVFQTLGADWGKQVRALYVEATGDGSGADSLSPQAMGQELQEKAAPGEPDALQRRIAEERAGMVPAPAQAQVAKASAFERYFRALTSLGDDAERAMAVVLGGEKAHKLRARNGGWPVRMALAGCRDGATAGEPE